VNLFLRYAWDDPFFFGAWVIIIAFSICVHEYAHARLALWFGDETAADQGHLTLNPFKQMGLTALIALLAIGIAWGAVPVDPRRLRTRLAAAAVAFAGPAANLLLAVVSALLWSALVRGDVFDGEAGHVALFLKYAAYANSTLFLFNLLPVPILDGWSVGALFFPSMLKITSRAAQNMSWIVLFVLVVTPLGNFVWSYGEQLGGLILRLGTACLGHG
jgi:Zn-dependent protease